MTKPKKYFLTYGTSEFNLQKKHLCNLAKKLDFFDKTIALSPNDLDVNFKNKYSEILSQSTGGGFYLWKYKIIKDSLSQLKKDDILFYLDAGSSINYQAKDRFNYYLEMLLSNNKTHLAFKQHHLKEKFWTHKELFKYFNMSVEGNEGESGQFMGGVQMYKNSSNSIDYLNSFEKVIDDDVLLITDHYVQNKQIEGFKYHRHDQSIFSLLNKIHGCEEIDSNETYFKENPKDQYSFPILTVRKRKYKFLNKLFFYLSYSYSINKTIFFKEKSSLIERIIYKVSKKLYKSIY